MGRLSRRSAPFAQGGSPRRLEDARAQPRGVACAPRVTGRARRLGGAGGGSAAGDRPRHGTRQALARRGHAALRAIQVLPHRRGDSRRPRSGLRSRGDRTAGVCGRQARLLRRPSRPPGTQARSSTPARPLVCRRALLRHRAWLATLGFRRGTSPRYSFSPGATGASRGLRARALVVGQAPWMRISARGAASERSPSSLGVAERGRRHAHAPVLGVPFLPGVGLAWSPAAERLDRDSGRLGGSSLQSGAYRSGACDTAWLGERSQAPCFVRAAFGSCSRWAAAGGRTRLPCLARTRPRSVIPLPVGAGHRFRPPALHRATAAGAPATGLHGGRRPRRRHGAHLELYAHRRSLVVPAGIGVARPVRRRGAYVRGGRCWYPIHRVEPTGVIQMATGVTPTLGTFFDLWRPLARRARWSAQPVPAMISPEPRLSPCRRSPLQRGSTCRRRSP